MNPPRNFMTSMKKPLRLAIMSLSLTLSMSLGLSFSSPYSSSLPSTFLISMAQAAGDGGFMGNSSDMYRLLASASLSLVAIGASIGGAFANEVTPEQLRDTVYDLHREIGKRATDNLILAMNNCNDPETIRLPERAPIAQKVLASYEQVYFKCLQP